MLQPLLSLSQALKPVPLVGKRPFPPAPSSGEPTVDYHGWQPYQLGAGTAHTSGTYTSWLRGNSTVTMTALPPPPL